MTWRRSGTRRPVRLHLLQSGCAIASRPSRGPPAVTSCAQGTTRPRDCSACRAIPARTPTVWVPRTVLPVRQVCPPRRKLACGGARSDAGPWPARIVQPCRWPVAVPAVSGWLLRRRGGNDKRGRRLQALRCRWAGCWHPLLVAMTCRVQETSPLIPAPRRARPAIPVRACEPAPVPAPET